VRVVGRPSTRAEPTVLTLCFVSSWGTGICCRITNALSSREDTGSLTSNALATIIAARATAAMEWKCGIIESNLWCTMLLRWCRELDDKDGREDSEFTEIFCVQGLPSKAANLCIKPDTMYMVTATDNRDKSALFCVPVEGFRMSADTI
jgi:hypothetical protein